MAGIAVALSGGGYRASLFGLGVLLYLADAGKNSEVSSVSSVSGGSITNAFVAQIGGYQRCSGAQFRDGVRPLVRTIAHDTLWATPRTWAYLGLLILSLLAIVYVSFLVPPWSWWARALLFLVFLLPWGWLLQQRGIVAGRAFASKLYSPSGTPTRLDDIEHDIDHVICATHLNAGEHFYFSGRFVYSYRFGWGRPGKLPLHAAVQASAAFPGGFPPRWMRTGRFHLEGGRGRPGPVPRLVTLADGGVYDNMADEWPSRVAQRAREKPDLNLRVPDQLIVVNSSAGLRWSPVRRLRVPFLGEFLSLLRDIDVMYDNSASLRMQRLVQQFQSAQNHTGALVNIEQSPFKLPKAYAHGSSPEAHRARAAIEKLGDKENEWNRIAADNAAIKTTLSKLGTNVSAQLMRQGYVVAMANLHTVLGYPLLNVPDVEGFEALAR